MSSCIIPGHDGGAPKFKSFREAVETCAPPLDSVELWITPTVAHDYEQRGAFQELLATLPIAVRSGARLYFVCPALADQVLADSAQRATEVEAGQKTAYNGHARRLRAALKDAARRPALFDADKPKCVSRWDWGERWIGTFDQLLTLGVKRIPGVADDTARGKLVTSDARGYPARVCKSTSLWAGLFEVTITLPRRTSVAPESQPSPELSGLAPSPVVFRQRATKIFEHVAIDLRKHLQRDVGYRYSKEAIESFMDAMAEAREALQEGEIVGRSRDQEILRVATQRAKDDKQLQGFLARIGNLPLGPDV